MKYKKITKDVNVKYKSYPHYMQSQWFRLLYLDDHSYIIKSDIYKGDEPASEKEIKLFKKYEKLYNL